MDLSGTNESTSADTSTSTSKRKAEEDLPSEVQAKKQRILGQTISQEKFSSIPVQERNGRYVICNETNEVITVANYQQGRKHGWYEEKRDGGRVFALYKEGKINGPFIEHRGHSIVITDNWGLSRITDDKPCLHSDSLFLALDGRRGDRQTTYHRMVLEGDSVIYSRQNKHRVVGIRAYKEGKLEGSRLYFYDGNEADTETEKLRKIITFKESVRHGLIKFYDGLGRVTMEGYYKEGKKHGTFKYYRAVDGRDPGPHLILYKYANYHEGVLEGPFREDDNVCYYINGKLYGRGYRFSDRYYLNDREVDENIFNMFKEGLAFKLNEVRSSDGEVVFTKDISNLVISYYMPV